ncbi:MAG: hypothetical protein JNM91_04345, partial [Flavobacteriales bacterium]|nr:hypothetical protein [Flavobacteriales bacterium]
MRNVHLLKRKLLLPLLGCIVLLAYPQAEFLDPSFSDDGTVIFPNGSGPTSGRCQLITADGRILIAGVSGPFSTSDYSIARLNSDGTLDAGFGGDGTIRTDFPGNFATINRLLDAGDDGYYAVGSFGTNFIDNMVIAAYDTTGGLRADWGVDGLCVVGYGEDTSLSVYDGALLPDGKLLVAGTYVQGSPAQIILFRINADGTMDETFGTGGRVQVSMGISSTARRIKVLPDGRIIGAGTVRTDPNDFLGGALLCRFLPDGTVDDSFALNGFLQFEISALSEAFVDIEKLPDGRIAAVGSRSFGTSTTACLVAMFNADGTLDPGFSGDGFELIDIANGIDALRGIAVDQQQRLVMAGVSEFGENGFDRGLVLRYLMDGTPDPSFGVNGRFLFGEDSQSHRFHAVGLQADGRIVASGEAENQFFAARLLPEASTGIRNPSALKTRLLLYPNPTSDHVRTDQLFSGNAVYQVLDATGRTVSGGSIEPHGNTPSGGRFQLPTTLSPGSYTL